MIRPSALVYWNYLKGWVEEFSRALKSLCYTNSSENPIVSVLGRWLAAQVNNAALAHRLSIGKRRGLLPDPSSHIDTNHKKAKSALRHDTARCGTFAGFLPNVPMCKSRKLQYSLVRDWSLTLLLCPNKRKISCALCTVKMPQ